MCDIPDRPISSYYGLALHIFYVSFIPDRPFLPYQVLLKEKPQGRLTPLWKFQNKITLSISDAKTGSTVPFIKKDMSQSYGQMSEINLTEQI